MYILIRIGHNDCRSNEKVSRTKSALIRLLKEDGYYLSSKSNRYINDNNSGIDGGSGVDYIIDECDEIT